MSSASEELVETGRQMARLVSESAELEEEELREGGLSGEKSARLVLAYLGTGEPRAALDLCRRMEEKDPALIAVTEAVFARQQSKAHAKLAGHSWPTPLKELVTVVIQCLRVGYLGVVSRAFSSIRLPYLAERLGLPASEAAAAVAKLGWTISPDHPDVLIVVPVPGLPIVPRPVAAAKDTTETNTLTLLTEYVSFLEN